MPKTIYEVLWVFIIYAFLGWCTEVSYAALDRGVFVNRGFLNGPYCPIYGFGVLAVIELLTPLKENLLILYVGSVLLTSALEFITGYVLERVFKNKWWDYSDKPFNIKGYICLKFSILWGFACVFIMMIIHPIIYKFIKIIPPMIGIGIIIILILVFCTDCAVTLSTILKFNRRLKGMEELAGKLKALSNEIGENIYENVAEAIEKKAEIDVEMEEIKIGIKNKKEQMEEEIEELNRKYKELEEQKNIGQRRLLKAFPGIKSQRNNEALEHLKQQLKKEKKES